MLDVSARAAYNKVIIARKATELRNKQLDSKRQKLKSELEYREKQAFLNTTKQSSYSVTPKTPEEILQDEIERLRKEGSKLLEEEQELMRQQLANEQNKIKNREY